ELKSIFEHDDNAEMRADCVSARKDFLDDLRPRVGRDVEVFCGLAAQQIADTAAGVVRDVPGRAQAAHDLTSALFHRRFHGRTGGILTHILPKMKLSMHWILPLIPAASALRYWPPIPSPPALTLCSSIATAPVA